MTNQELEILLSLRDEVTKKLNKIERSTEKSSKAMRMHWLKVSAAIVATGFVLKKLGDVATGVGKELVKVGSTVEQLKVRLQGLLGSVEEGNKVFEDMRDLAGQVPKTYEEIMAAATDLSAVVRGGSEEIKQLMPIIVDISAATGMAVREVNSQIIRMYSAGAAAADMFRERGVSAALGFQAGVSYSAEETMKTLTQQWEDGTGKFVGASEALAETFEGMTSMMADAWFNFKADVGEEFFKNIKIDLKAVLGVINDSKEPTGEYADIVEELGEHMTILYESTKEFAIAAIVGVGQAADAWNEFKLIVNSTAIGVMRVVEALEILRPKFRLDDTMLEGIRSTIEEMEAANTDFAQKSIEEHAETLRQQINDFREAMEAKKEIIRETEEEIANIQSKSPHSEVVQKDLKKASAAWKSYIESTQQFNTDSVKMLMKQIDTFSKGVSKSITGIIFENKKASESFKQLGIQMVQILIEWGVQALINAALSKVFAAVAVQEATATGTAIASAYAPAAAMASLASFGANSIPAMAGITATNILAQSLAAIPKAGEGMFVDKPTLVMAGEAGPEVIMPLGKGIGGQTIYFDIHDITVRSDDDLDEMIEEISYRFAKDVERT